MLENLKTEEFDVIIQAGQSNSEGCGLGDTAVPFVPSDKILYLNGNNGSFAITIAQEQISGSDTIGNFSLSFASEYIKNGKLQDGRRLLILRTAVGGTGFSDKRWGMTDDLFLRMMEMIKAALSLNSKNKLIALLWHQGETDAGYNASYDTHYQNLTNLVSAVRNTFGYDSLPFVAGDFVNEWKTANIKICEPVIESIKNICADIGNAKFIETSELLSNNQKIANGDTIHFCREALNILGVKYFEAFCDVTKSSNK